MSDIVKGGIADADGRLVQGDQILTVNGEDVRNATQEAVAALLKVKANAARTLCNRMEEGGGTKWATAVKEAPNPLYLKCYLK